jgi:hypothetical protein
LAIACVKMRRCVRPLDIGLRTLLPNVHRRSVSDRTRSLHTVGRWLRVGRDSSDAVGGEYQSPRTFKGGTILGVAVTVEKGQYLDLEKMAMAAFTVDQRPSTSAYDR